MSRCRLLPTWLFYFGLISTFGLATCNFIDEYDDGDYEEDLNYQFPGSGNEESSVVLLSKRDPAYTPYISVGALSNMQQFFENLKENFHSLENLSQDGKKALLGRHELSPEQDTRVFRPPATAAYLHAVRNQKPSHKIKSLVSKMESVPLRSNSYSPAYFWTGLGRRR